MAAVESRRRVRRVSGLVRQEDIDGSNTVSSLRLADARLAYSGTGELADSNSAGWLTRFFLSPLHAVLTMKRVCLLVILLLLALALSATCPAAERYRQRRRRAHEPARWLRSGGGARRNRRQNQPDAVHAADVQQHAASVRHPAADSARNPSSRTSPRFRCMRRCPRLRNPASRSTSPFLRSATRRACAAARC